jgi:hypothetical protein
MKPRVGKLPTRLTYFTQCHAPLGRRGLERLGTHGRGLRIPGKPRGLARPHAPGLQYQQLAALGLPALARL